MAIFSKGGSKDKEDETPDIPESLPVSGDQVSPNAGPQHKPSIISEGFSFVGEVNATGSLSVEGKLSGTVNLSALNISATGAVDGIVNSAIINVKGKLSGTVSCGDLIIGGRATVSGKITYKKLTIQKGGVIMGEIKQLPAN
jgi:cytoskeletal protein CcmA (bactofilin family)